MFITDSQIHIWAADTPERPWLRPKAQRPVPLEVDEVLAEMDAAGVSRFIAVPPSWEGHRNDVALAAAERYPDRVAVMGRINLSDPSSVDVSSWREQTGMLGARLTFHEWEPAPDEVDWFWPLAVEADIPVMVYAPSLIPVIGEVARRYPELRIIVDHLGLRSRRARSEGIGPMIEPLLALSDIETIAVKVSALPCSVAEGYPFPSLRPHVRRVVDAFGIERCMWGSDLSQLPCPYPDWVNAATEGFGFLTETEVEWLMDKSLSQWLRWPAGT